MPALSPDAPDRGEFDTMYCDENNDLVADAPLDVAKQKDPPTLVFSYSPVEDPAVYQKLFKPFTDYLGQCVGKRVVYFPVQSNSAKSKPCGPDGSMSQDLNRADSLCRQPRGRSPIRRQGRSRADARLSPDLLGRGSSYQKLSDKGKRVAHTAPSSNSSGSACVLCRRRSSPMMAPASHVGRARQVGVRRRVRRLRHGGGRVGRLRPHGDA